MIASARHPLLDLHPEVAAALAGGRAVVALESTLIAHGMPWPHNLQTAQALETQVRAEGAVPATIAILDGRFKVGLTNDQLERLARQGPALPKASRRDLAVLAARGASGATTVAATMILAALAGIRVFATGGIGGVHRGAAQSMDISADLLELARTPVAVVCAGPKAVLDISLTLEVLETHGVPVLGYQCDELPAFWTRDSGYAVDACLPSPAAIAAVMRAHWQLEGAGGLLIANPIPTEYALPRERIAAATAQALEDADAQGLRGKAVTPYLLARVSELTGGDSLASNVQLVLNNARLAAQVAVQVAVQFAGLALGGEVRRQL